MRNERTVEFLQLHSTGCFVMPNPWDAGSARALELMGFKALATTSSGLAWTYGRTDNQVTLDEVLEHLRAVADAVSVPVSADFEGGFAHEPEDVATNVMLATNTGISGLSIEDSSGEEAAPLFEFNMAVDRVRAARQAIDDSGTGIVLTARSEGFVCGRPDLEETVGRLGAYAEAGADCLYAPGIRTVQHVAALVAAVSPKPLNVLIDGPFTTVAEMAQLGVRRVSVGGALASSAWAGFLQTAQEIAHTGTFSRFQDLPNVDSLLR